MSTEQLRNAVAGTAGQKPAGLPALLEKMKPQLALALPKHMNPDRMLRIALTQLRVTPKLAQCEPQSVMACVVMASQLGLEPGINGQAYLIPYEDRRKGVTICQFVPGWKGLVDLAMRSGRSSVRTGAVYAGDYFEYELGTHPFLKHKPGDEIDPKALTHCYAVGNVRGAEYPVIEVWSKEKLLAHRKLFNKVGERHYSFTNDHNFEMYGRKVTLLQVLKYMPQSIELATAVHLDTAAETGKQALDMKDALEGTFVPASDDEGDAGREEGAGQQAGDQPLSVEQFKDLMRAAQSTESLKTLWDQHKGPFKGDQALEVEAFYNVRKDQLKEARK
jgi:recombination protein RecT